jgi:hypothetical protein
VVVVLLMLLLSRLLLLLLHRDRLNSCFYHVFALLLSCLCALMCRRCSRTVNTGQAPLAAFSESAAKYTALCLQLTSQRRMVCHLLPPGHTCQQGNRTCR